MSCCEGWSSDKSEINGKCPDCGIDTVDGEAAYGCAWSPVECETCDESC